MIAPSDHPVLFRLTGLLALAALVAAGAGVADPSLYRPGMPERMIPGAVGQDLLTLAAAAGLMGCLVAVRRGARWPWLVWAGLVGYLLYAYALYAFDRVYNPLFLLYVAILGLSVYALVAFFARADLSAVGAQAERPPPRRITAGLFVLLVLLFTLLWLSILVPAMATRVPPEGSAVFVLDFALVLPLLTIEALLLLRKRPLGDVLAVPLLVKVATLGISVLLGTLLAPLFGRALPVGEVPIYAVMGLLPALLVVPFLRRLRVAAPTSRPYSVP